MMAVEMRNGTWQDISKFNGMEWDGIDFPEILTGQNKINPFTTCHYRMGYPVRNPAGIPVKSGRFMFFHAKTRI